jgi:hypothetical protein
VQHRKSKIKINVNGPSSFGVGPGVKIKKYQLDYTFIP